MRKITLDQAEYIVDTLKKMDVTDTSKCLMVLPTTKTKLRVRIDNISNLQNDEMILMDNQYLRVFKMRVQQGNKLRAQRFIYNRLNEYLMAKQRGA